jgi:hypothetical protein
MNRLADECVLPSISGQGDFSLGWPRPARRITRFIGCYQRIGCWSPTDEALERRTFSCALAAARQTKIGMWTGPSRSDPLRKLIGTAAAAKEEEMIEPGRKWPPTLQNKIKGKYENILPEQQQRRSRKKLRILRRFG